MIEEMQMVRGAQMITKYGVILVNFIEGKQLPFSNTPSDVLLEIAPHQSDSLVNIKSIKKSANVGQKNINASCVCIENNPKTRNSLDTLFLKSIKEGKSLLWLDPTLIPTECLGCTFAKWLKNTKPTDNISLGVVIPQSDIVSSVKNNFKAWVAMSRGPLKKEFEEIDLPVWYPSLNRKPEFFEKVTSAVKPFDVFPIVEFPRVIDYDSEKEIAAHHFILDRYRTRTRNLIYLNNKSPEEALKTLFGSFKAISRNGKMPRSLLVTPGGTSISYIITLLAGVFSDGTFITPEMETPFPKRMNIWGFAILKKA
jgi:hypothetical protein